MRDYKNKMFYKIDFKCDDKEELQSKLNHLYNYKDDVSTKVLHRNRLNLFCLLMKKLIENNVIESFDSAIDIGCNTGVYSKIISDFGFTQVLGIDIVDEAIERANDFFAFSNNKKVLEYKLLNAEDITTIKKYDFILCTEVIEHTDNPFKVIENIKSILAPGGIAIITLPNRVSLPYLLTFFSYKIRKKHDKVLEQHLNYPFYKSIKVFRDIDIRIIETSGTNLIFNGIILHFLYATSIFSRINKINFYLSRIWPLKYFTQFFFIVLKKDPIKNK